MSTNTEKQSVPSPEQPIYAFRREEKPEITSELFVYCKGQGLPLIVV